MSFYARDQKENDDVDVGGGEGEKMKLEVVVCRKERKKDRAESV